ncbi:MAG TPA: VOC family protein [Dehalococcoidia bacterium]|nr:VOC family protein [Dehalococcoidia bacterium]
MAGITLHHVATGIPPGTEEQARSFYGGLLGLKEIPKPAPLVPRGGLWFETSDGCELHLQADQPDDFKTRRHIGLETPDGPTLKQKLEAAGHETEDDPDFPGYSRFYVHDPWGNRLEILTPE